jgi:hypothetical protein
MDIDTIRVHPKGFRFLFYLYHGSAAVGFVLIAGSVLQIIPYDTIVILGLLMISIPFFLIPPELIFLLEKKKLIFRHGFYCATIPFKDIYKVETSVSSIEMKNLKNITLIEICKEHYKNIDLFELSNYIQVLLSGDQKVDPMKYTAVKFLGCGLLDRFTSAFGKLFWHIKNGK